MAFNQRPVMAGAVADMAPIDIKLELLSFGVRLTPSLLANYGRPYLQKRRAYGNPDPVALRTASIPQELYLGGGALVCAVNVRLDSPWTLDYADGQFFLRCAGRQGTAAVGFPLHPRYYDQRADDGFSVAELATLYGGAALGIFVYGDCALVTAGKACHYCSIEPNRSKSSGFQSVIAPDDVYRAIVTALALDDGSITQVMLNGGNFPDLDRNFAFYLRIAQAARRAVDASGKALPIHLIAFPPRNRALLRELAGLGVEVAFNTEVYDPQLFARYCPGKHADGGQRLLFDAIEESASVLGAGRVYSIFVGGLEPLPSLRAGLAHVARLGGTPVINVFHADPETPLAQFPVAAPAAIHQMGWALQETYQQFGISQPFYDNCGRNSLDSEAHRRLFQRAP
ncbi:radical SAM protein [Duganella sp. CF458]|uniref:radical SAM protein n=1 Tax=Duganella sp. CF458 TaxID=1884368 RepID=UPI0011146640|nr:radical SAM protein [Duganella sp. CF458]